MGRRIPTMEFSLYEILSGIFVTLYLVRCWLTKTFDYWKKRRVVGPRPLPIFGSFKDVVLNKINAVDFVKSIYDAYPNEPAVGLFSRSVPTLLLRDSSMIKDVLIKSFSTFKNRGLKIHEDIEMFPQNLVFLEYKRWKSLRRKLTPAFTPERVKQIFYLIEECSENFVTYLEILVAKGKPIECRELTKKFTADVIGVCAFGLDMNTLADKDNQFRKITHELFANSWITRLRVLSRTFPHWVAVMLKPIIRSEKTINFFINTVKNRIDYRKANNIRRNDFIDLLMDMQDHPEQGHGNVSDIFLTSQAFVFVAAGFETSSTTMSNVIYELALNPDIQEKLRQEINAAYKENNGKLDYGIVRNMKYLNQVFLETLRKYPTTIGLMRESVDDHMFEESKILISKGVKIFIPTHAIHHDANIYPEPEKFDPKRFEAEAIKLRPQMSFLPFGDGPRNCIGEQFARSQIKLGLVGAIRNFKFEVCDKTLKVYKKRLRSLLLIPEGDLYLKVKKL